MPFCIMRDSPPLPVLCPWLASGLSHGRAWGCSHESIADDRLILRMQAEITSRGPHASASFDAEEERPLPPARTRLVRAAGVAAVWVISALPIALGLQGCT